MTRSVYTFDFIDCPVTLVVVSLNNISSCNAGSDISISLLRKRKHKYSCQLILQAVSNFFFYKI